MKESFHSKTQLGPKRLARLNQINDILEEYVADGYVLTLRQLYYQLVSRDIIPNNDKEYKKLGEILVAGRMSGVVDWAAIEDRVRVPKLPYWVLGISDALSDTYSQYRLNRQENQTNYVEVWVEKDALSGIFSRITSHYHVNLMVNRGYSSASAMYSAYNRFKSQIANGHSVTVLYFGDHDPSGLDMIRDVNDRVREMLDHRFGSVADRYVVEQIALNMDQIREFNPPPNPAKITDSRANWYIEKYGPMSWELDALPPSELASLCDKAIKKNIDLDLFMEMIEKENEQKTILKSIIKEHE